MGTPQMQQREMSLMFDNKDFEHVVKQRGAMSSACSSSSRLSKLDSEFQSYHPRQSAFKFQEESEIG